MKFFMSVVGYVFCTLILILIFYHRRALVAFFVASRQEMRRVVWPTPQRAFEQMKAVLISLLIFSAFFGLVDYVLYRLADSIF